MLKRFILPVPIVAAALLAGCAHDAPGGDGRRGAQPRGAVARAPSQIPIRSLDDVPLGVYEALSPGGRSLTLERDGAQLVLTTRRWYGERVVVYHISPQPNGRLVVPEMGGYALFVRDGGQILFGFSACYIEGLYYRYRPV